MSIMQRTGLLCTVCGEQDMPRSVTDTPDQLIAAVMDEVAIDKRYSDDSRPNGGE
jgi:hypothetical protein